MSDSSDAGRAESSTSATSTDSNAPSCGTCIQEATTPMMASHAEYTLKEGQFLFDVLPNDMEVFRWANLLSSSSVYRLFYAYTTIISRDANRCTTAFKSNTDLNRYLDIPCIEDNRVKLLAFNDSDYYHANYVDGFRKSKKYICAQGPIGNTITRFWEMVWQENSVIVVAMNDPDLPYYPQASKGKEIFGDIVVANQGTRNCRNAYDATVLTLSKGTEKRTILHLEYYDWPHKCTPRSPNEVLNIVADVNHNAVKLRKKAEKAGWLKKDEPSPIIVHCMTGVGRSASLIALDIVCEKMKTSHAEGKCLIDITETVTRLRTQRAMAVHKPEQFVVVTLTAMEYAIRNHFIKEKEAEELRLSNFALFPDTE